MIYISHRGNLTGSIPEFENTPTYIKIALNDGFDVEVDVRLIDNKLYLGHDSSGELIDIEILKNPHFWVHAKTIDTLYELLKYKEINCFYHNKDKCTLTSKGYIWTYPGCYITKSSIEIAHNFPYKFDTSAYALCSDNIASHRGSK